MKDLYESKKAWDSKAKPHKLISKTVVKELLPVSRVCFALKRNAKNAFSFFFFSKTLHLTHLCYILGEGGGGKVVVREG